MSLVCIVRNNKPVKVELVEADELVAAGKARFISRTEFKILKAGISVPSKVKAEGDRAVKDYIKTQRKPDEKK